MSTSTQKPLNIILLGPPGSGKSTQARVLVQRFGLRHIDVGAALRKIAREDTPLGREVDRVINRDRTLVPDAVVTEVVDQEIAAVPAGQGIILDGAPRRESQIAVVEEIFRKHGRAVTCVVFIRVGEHVSVARVAARFACSACGRPLILGEHLPDASARCPDCGGTPVQRADDTPEGVQTRWRVFHDDTNPVIQHYRLRSALCEVDGEVSPEATEDAIVLCLERQPEPEPHAS